MKLNNGEFILSILVTMQLKLYSLYVMQRYSKPDIVLTFLQLIVFRVRYILCLWGDNRSHIKWIFYHYEQVEHVCNEVSLLFIDEIGWLFNLFRFY